MSAWRRINHDQGREDPPGVQDVPAWAAGLLALLVLPVALLWWGWMRWR